MSLAATQKRNVSLQATSFPARAQVASLAPEIVPETIAMLGRLGEFHFRMVLKRCLIQKRNLIGSEGTLPFHRAIAYRITKELIIGSQRVSSSVPRLEASGICRRFGSAQAVSKVSFSVLPGEVLCLLGPSGCGKSTTLRIVSGVERQDTGSIAIDGDVVSDAHRHSPPESRSVGLLFQDFALFPHITVAENIAFGIRERGSKRKRRVDELLSKVMLHGVQDRYPHELSGGEQQRAALARAMGPRPKIMLMDEPFSNLDSRLRDSVRDEMLALLKGEEAAIVLVTHEPGEAMRTADKIALMRSGRIVQTGVPYEIYNQPTDRKAAEFFSEINLIHGVVRNLSVDTAFGRFPAPGMVEGADVEIMIRPQHMRVDFDRNGTGPVPTDNDGVAARGVVLQSRYMGSISLVEFRMDHDDSLLKVIVPSVFLPRPGMPLWLSIKRDKYFMFPCEDQSKVGNPYLGQAGVVSQAAEAALN